MYGRLCVFESKVERLTGVNLKLRVEELKLLLKFIWLTKVNLKMTIANIKRENKIRKDKNNDLQKTLVR